jgi:small subunit ribosomal protein S27e
MSTLDVAILHPTVESEKRKNKKKLLVPNPRSEFLSLRCPGCNTVTTAFSHSNVPIICEGCQAPIAFPTGGRIRLIDTVLSRPRLTA